MSDNNNKNKNGIAEVCAELALYRIMIDIDEIREHYSNDALKEIEAMLWKLLEELQSSQLVRREASRNHRME